MPLVYIDYAPNILRRSDYTIRCKAYAEDAQKIRTKAMVNRPWPRMHREVESISTVSHAEKRETRVKAEPEHDVPQDFVALDGRNATNHDQRDLDELMTYR